MEKNVKAVFYKYKYYILPPEFENIDSIESGTVINAKRLKEENCMAPDFIYESIVDETLEVEQPELLFNVEVNLYSAEEYDKLLTAQVERICKGCGRYVEDDNELDLEGHYRELSLNGVCYEREDDDTVTLAMRIRWFYGQLAKNLDELAECIENGDNEKFDKICSECAKYIPSPVKFFGCKNDGKYRLYWHTALGSELYYTMLKTIAIAANDQSNPLLNAGWEVLPYIPKAPDLYIGSVKDNMPVAYLTQSQVPWRYYIHVFADKNNQNDELLFDLHRYLSYNLGEDLVLNAIDGYEWTEDKSRLITPTEICETLKKRAEEWQGYEFPPIINYSWQDEGTLPYRKSVEGASICYTCASIGVDSDVANIHFDYGFAFAYIFVPTKQDKIESIWNVLATYFANKESIPGPIRLENDFIFSFVNTGFCECSVGEQNEEGFSIDFLVTDEKEFYRFLKILAPVLKSYNARLVVVNESGVNEYVCDFEITPVNTDESN